MKTNVVPFPRGPKLKRKVKSGYALEHDLSFVRVMPRQIGGYCYWSVEPQKQGEDGWPRGANMAKEFLSFMGEHPTYGNTYLLNCIVGDMPSPITRLEMGFLKEINEAAMLTARLIRERIL